EYFNTAAFVQPILAFGDVGRNTMTGANLVNLDATLARTFRITEKVGLQFRAEFFNLANHPNYNLIGRIVNDPSFGIVQNQLPPRQIQRAMKISLSSLQNEEIHRDTAREKGKGRHAQQGERPLHIAPKPFHRKPAD